MGPASRAFSVLAACLLLAAAPQRRRTDSPLDHLPPNVEMLTHFGERADISPDNRSVAFMAKSFGDAFVIDLKTRAIRCLTCNVPGAAFLRVMHLSDRRLPAHRRRAVHRHPHQPRRATTSSGSSPKSPARSPSASTRE